jgi:hypothetical protein
MTNEEMAIAIVELRARVKELESGHFGGATIRCGGMLIRDSEGQFRVALTVLGSGPQLAMTDCSGKPRLMAGVGNDDDVNRPSFSLHSKTGETLIELGVSDQGGGKARFFSDEQATNTLYIGESPKGNESTWFGLALIDKSDVALRAVWSIDGDVPRMTMFASDDTAIDMAAAGGWKRIAWIAADGQPTFIVDDDQ